METWVANSTARLVHVPWDSGYQRVVQFASTAARDEYFEHLECDVNLTFPNETYIRPNTPLVIDAPYSAVYGANYLVVHNQAQPVDGARDETLFYFITDTQYASPASTRLVLQLDVWQTRFMAGATLGGGFVERGHLPVKLSATATGGTTAALRRYCTAPEGIDIGNAYDTANVHDESMMRGDPYLMVLSSADLSADAGTVQNPNLTVGGTQIIDGMPSGGWVCVVDGGNVQSFFQAISEIPWVSQNILSFTYVPHDAISLDGATGASVRGVPVHINFKTTDALYSAWTVDFADCAGATDYSASDLKSYKKLLSYPYSVVELTAFNGNQLLLKPEQFGSDSITFRNFFEMLPPFGRWAVVPVGYSDGQNGKPIEQTARMFGSDKSVTLYNGDFLNTALFIDNFPQFSTPSNNYLSYMARTANTRQYQYDSAGWSLAASRASTQNAYDQAQWSAATAQANQQVQNTATNANQAIAGVNAGVGVAGNLLTSNLGGALTGALSGVSQYATSEIAQQASNALFRNQQALTYRVADANQRLASYVAQGNYQNAIAGINATVQDAELTSPSIVGQTGGDGWRFAQGLYTLVLRVKSLPTGAAARVLQYFKRYGYAYNQWVDMGAYESGLNIMDKFSYWRVHDLVLECAAANETESDAIRGIFDRGVTVYSDPDAIGDGNAVAQNYVPGV